MDSQGEDIRRSAQERYASGNAVWTPSDRWNSVKREGIDRFCKQVLANLSPEAAVLNAGAGSHRYDWLPDNAVNMDRFAEQIRQLPNPVVGDIEDMPFEAGSFDVVICVGPVLNYTSAMEAISELARVLKPRGQLVLHYEASDSAEHLLTERWRQDAAPLHTFNNGNPDMVWIYSRSFISRALRRNGIKIEQEEGFHIASAALLRLGVQPNRAASAARLDRLLSPFSMFADDVILAGRKAAG